jgi:hypothetical protein
VEALKIIGVCILAAVVYGILHDQVTARVCVEYFTIGHPRIFATDSPTLLGIGWGVVATWWVGLILGALLAFAAIRGRRPRRSVRSLLRPITVLLATMGVISVVAGLVGFILAQTGSLVLVGSLASSVPADRHALFIADLWAHSASYLTGFVGGVVLINRVWRSRRAMAYDPAQPAAAADAPQTARG